jgi:hypothetical protein
MQHYKLLMEALNKRHLAHIGSFKEALKLHAEHVQLRQKRVGEQKSRWLVNYKIWIIQNI